MHTILLQGFTPHTLKIPVHIPVLCQEVVNLLGLRPGVCVVDGTVGLGGHAAAILPHIFPGGRLIAIDADPQHLNYARDRLTSEFQSLLGDKILPDASPLFFFHGNFSQIAMAVAEVGQSQINAILLDLGLASPHVDDPERGFSFVGSGPLDMRFDTTQKFTAQDIVNSYKYEDLVRIFREYGEERYAGPIAKKIIQERKTQPITTTEQLVTLIETIKKKWMQKIHPATQVFQALRMEVNHELDHLQTAIDDAIDILAPHGRLAVIAYHSLEDRIVKQTFRRRARACICAPDVMICNCQHQPEIAILTKKPLIPSDIEIENNPRSRSAKLRVIEKALRGGSAT